MKTEEVKINILKMDSEHNHNNTLEERKDKTSSRPPPLAPNTDIWRPIAVVYPVSVLNTPLSSAVRRSFLETFYSGVPVPEDADIELEELEVDQLIEIDDYDSNVDDDDDIDRDDDDDGADDDYNDEAAEDNDDDASDEGDDGDDDVEVRPIFIGDDDAVDDDDEDEGDDEGDGDNGGDEARPVVVVIDDDDKDDDDVDAGDNRDGVYFV